MPYFEAILHTRAERHDFLHAAYGFNCSCAVCAASAEDIEASDARRARISDLKDVVEGWGEQVVEPEKALAAVEEAAELFEKEGYDVSYVCFSFLFFPLLFSLELFYFLSDHFLDD